MSINQCDKRELLECNEECYLLGILATEQETYPTIGDTQDAVAIMRNSDFNNIIFYIKSLTYEPTPISYSLNSVMQSDYYVGIDVYQSQSIFDSSYRLTSDINKKISMVRQKFENKLILFKPKINIKEVTEKIYKNLDVIATEDYVGLNLNMEFMYVPRIDISNGEFEKRLLNEEYIILKDYSHYMVTSPEYILCGEYLYTNFTKWKRVENKNKLWRHMGNNIKKIKLDFKNKDVRKKFIIGTKNLEFAERIYLENDIVEKLKDKFEIVMNTVQFNFEKIENKSIETQEKESFIDSAENTEEIERINKTQEDNTELKFLQCLKEYTIENELCYDEKDLYNFHLSVKTNPLTIIAGMSGTGKTRLASAYAKILGVEESEDTLLILPVSPSYTEPGDILGYLNNINKMYMPSETGLVDLLVHAQNNPYKMHMVIFDEMNLSQIEHWFAPFISVLELEGEERKIKLYAENVICDNKDKYPRYIHLRNNIIFVGTVNMDETTRDFSDRLLDRANIVVPQKRTFISLKIQKEENKDRKIIRTFRNKYSFSQYKTWINNEKTPLEAYKDEELKFLDDLHELIQKYDYQKGVSFRIFNRIGSYLNNIPKINEDEYLISREDAFDIQIKQRLLTKIRGSEKQFERLIGILKEMEGEPLNSELYNFFNSAEAQKISHFRLTKKEICRKAKELSMYGYTS
ncbi:McrB family protein [Hathewaya limosa]|uniref:Energy-coupling factor transporter ATP-binding protein EcfA2 n=1 Tax=Hathewaya limosa TaxID=1536 RepID=A0ABU0JVP4_HATLI|nr:hypothetical protein [Hathewaya limosa]MDQ0479982.1 energy-coupling factor transporter ATP-binding protein EcfA2 [Hathewaya limosa]